MRELRTHDTMKRPLHLPLMLLLAAMVGSCADHGPTVPGASGEVALHIGDSARLTGPTAFVKFARIDSDSRCPMGYMCFIAGEAVIELSGSGGGQTEIIHYGRKHEWRRHLRIKGRDFIDLVFP